MIENNIVKLSEDNLRFLDADNLAALNPYLDMKGFTRHARAAFFSLPPKVLSYITQFRTEGNESGFLLIKGLPTDPALIDTPTQHKQARQRACFLSEYCITMVGSYLGELYGFSQESSGSIFNNIRPIDAQSEKQSSESSGVFLELHTEIAFHEFRPDFLLLYCLRQDRELMAKTGVASIRKAMTLLSRDVLAELRKPLFSFAFDLSFGNERGRANSIKKGPVLEGPKDDPYMTYDSDLIIPLSEAASAALRALDVALRQTIQEVALEPGELIVVDNRRTSHSRTHFRAHYDGMDRWLQRAFVK